MTAGALTLALTLAAIWAVVCRINAMQAGVTRVAVFAQHAILGLALFGGLLLPPDWGRAALVAGVAIYLLMGSPRWRDGAPEGTRKPRSE